MTKVRFVSKTITVANATAAGDRPDTFIELPRDYKRCTGICAVEVTGGGINRNYSLGLDAVEGNETIGLVNAAAFGVVAPDTDVDPAKRFRDDVHFDIEEKRTRIKLTTNALTTSELRVEIVFRVEKQDC